MKNKFGSRLMLGGIAFAALALAGQAQAAKPVLTHATAAWGLNAAAPGANAVTSNFVVDVAGIKSTGEFGDPLNTIRNIQVGAFATITSLTWNVTLEAYDPSWLAEISLAFTDSAITDGVIFAAGIEDLDPGTKSYSGSINLISEGLSFKTGADGILRLEFHEDFDDSGVNPDGLWKSGTLTFGVSPVPEPATYGLMALGLLAVGGWARRRRVS